MKRKWLHELPYLLIALYATKIGQAWRLAEGKDAAHKLLSLMDSLSASFASPLPSFELHDLCIGLLLGAGFRLFIFIKDSEKKKYRKGREYGSARWGTPEDIKPFIDPVFANNVILTQTERLTMSSRPKNPAYARNKNVLIIGGSGSGKTRFFVKPNLMQCVSDKYPCSFVVTDPKGSILVECGSLLQRSDYRIKVLNTINFKKSMNYNPLAYIHSEKDILKLVNCLILNTKGEGKSNDPFWEKAETLLYTALIGYLYGVVPEEDRNFAMLVSMINAMEVREDDEDFKNPVDLMFEALEEREPEHFAVRQYKKFKLASVVVCSKYPLNHEIFS